MKKKIAGTDFRYDTGEARVPWVAVGEKVNVDDMEGIITPPLDSVQIKSTHHLYLLQLDPDRLKGDIQDLKKKLTQKGVAQIPHFAPLYKFSHMKQLGYDTEAIEKTCPNAEEAFQHRFTHLPLYPLTPEQLEYMADAVIESVEEMQR